MIDKYLYHMSDKLFKDIRSLSLQENKERMEEITQRFSLIQGERNLMKI